MKSNSRLGINKKMAQILRKNKHERTVLVCHSSARPTTQIIYNNDDSFSIRDVDVCLQRDGSELVIPLGNFCENFQPAFADTVDCSQSKAFDWTYALYEFDLRRHTFPGVTGACVKFSHTKNFLKNFTALKHFNFVFTSDRSKKPARSLQRGTVALSFLLSSQTLFGRSSLLFPMTQAPMLQSGSMGSLSVKRRIFAPILSSNWQMNAQSCTVYMHWGP